MVDTRTTSGHRKKGKSSISDSTSTIRGKPNKFNVMSSPSYWLAQIKKSEAVEEHQVSLGFFKLALEAGCKNVQLLRDELKGYCFRHKLVDVGESSCSKRVKKLFQRYNISSSVLPLDIQVEILKRLPIKSLIRCRSVSKQWKSLIGSSEFIVDYHLNCTRLQKRLLVRCCDPEDDRVPKFVSIVDDYTFPRLKTFLTAPTPVSTVPTVASYQGLFCFYQFYKNYVSGDAPNYGSPSNTVVLWNPTIRKSVSIDVPNVLDDPYETVIGFGVCPPTSDPMLVKITCYKRRRDNISSIPWQVEIFTLSSGLWRSPLCSNLPRKSISFYYHEDQTGIAIDGCIYWPAIDFENSYELIMSFDMTSETFTEVHLPECLARNGTPYRMILSKLKESLCVLELKGDTYNVWIMMQNGVLKSFTKLYNIIEISPEPFPLLGFRDNGVPIMKMKKCAVYTYEPNTEQLSYIGIYGVSMIPPFACNYIETLLLIDH